VTLKSEAPILLHNGQTSDPLNYYSKEIKKISAKRNKTDADHEELAKLEWFASIYINKSDQIVIPSNMLESMFVNGAKKTRQGKQAQAGFFVEENPLLEFDGDDLTTQKLWERDQNRHVMAVNVQRNKIMRTRFIAEDWGLSVTCNYNDEHFNKSAVVEIFQTAGANVGIGDWRPKFGRFYVEDVK
jgi:hypothetical protein